MPTGYSGTPLIKKLGIKPGQRLAFVEPPAGYAQTLVPLPDGLEVKEQPDGELDFIQYFTKIRSELEDEFPRMKRRLAPDGMLWISWPKRSSQVATDVNENVVGEVGLANGLVDVKICTVDEAWSGLKFVFRLKERP